ncbi:hypothetical protein NC651_012052 [Populus alba x Populus x berolinensis]|nr:hypothetical protein NC651_012052 [Populus alba x Populus x berolinensis]
MSGLSDAGRITSKSHLEHFIENSGSLCVRGIRKQLVEALTGNGFLQTITLPSLSDQPLLGLQKLSPMKHFPVRSSNKITPNA